MFGWFPGRTRSPVTFESNPAAFDYACTLQKREILLEAEIPALVLESGTVDDDGVRHFLLRLADKEGGRELWACTLKEATLFPRVGDFVSFRVVKIAADLPEEARVIGYIAAKLSPVWIERKGWQVMENYTPANIKPSIRW